MVLRPGKSIFTISANGKFDFNLLREIEFETSSFPKFCQTLQRNPLILSVISCSHSICNKAHNLNDVLCLILHKVYPCYGDS